MHLRLRLRSCQMLKKLEFSNFMKTLPVRAEFLYTDVQTDRQTDRQDVANSRFSQFYKHT